MMRIVADGFAMKNLTTIDPLSRLEEKIATLARERNVKQQKVRDDQAVKDQRQDQARAVWTKRKAELPGIVEAIDDMLKRHGYAGIAIGTMDQKHSDIDRTVIQFEHTAHHHSKILLCMTRAGDFTCSIGALSGDAGSMKVPSSELTEDRLKDVLAQAVEACLTGERSTSAGK